MDNLDIEALCRTLYPVAASAGVDRNLINRAVEDVQLDRKVLELAESQPEHTHTVGHYVNTLVSAERIMTGRNVGEIHGELLNKVAKVYGIPAQILVAIWGVEANFGTHMGNFPVLRSLATLIAKGGKRQFFWCEQFVAAVYISKWQNIPAQKMTGSWAGAMGHMQFIPTTYRDFAVDFDGDGRADIWLSIADALASAANYLHRSGWRQEQVWGMEVALPSSFDFNHFADGELREQGVWQSLGISLMEDQWPCDSHTSTYRLSLPSGAEGPAFLVTANFDVILTYNAALPYALAVTHLADRMSEKGTISTPWPKEIPLSLQERKALQQSLVNLGYDTGGIDGVLGRASRLAIRQYQMANGFLADGYPSQRLLAHLQQA